MTAAEARDDPLGVVATAADAGALVVVAPRPAARLAAVRAEVVAAETLAVAVETLAGVAESPVGEGGRAVLATPREPIPGAL